MNHARVVPIFIGQPDQVRYQKFTPLDRESPIFEVVADDDVIIMDVARSDGNDLHSPVVVTSHNGAASASITVDTLNAITRHAEGLVRCEESEAGTAAE